MKTKKVSKKVIPKKKQITQNPLHIRIEYMEAVESKRDLLSTEANLIQIRQAIKKYQDLRIQELRLKLKIQKAVKEVESEIAHLEKILPQIRIPRYLVEETFDNKPLKILSESPRSQDLESQLKEIQEKLRGLQRR
ncbi:Uncharacterised protein [uncultured archaeon]|nr:Uncharacterised protein [uncultured archaeon]